MYACVYIYMCVCMHVYIYIYIYIYIYTHTHIRTYIHREDGLAMYGDYEAQRHWMEVTLHTPIKVVYMYMWTCVECV